MVQWNLEILSAEYLRTKSKQAEDALCNILKGPVISSIRGWLGGSGMAAHSREDMEAYAVAAIVHAIRRWDGRGSILLYTRQYTRQYAIADLRTITGFRRSVKEIAVENIEKIAVQTQHDDGLFPKHAEQKRSKTENPALVAALNKMDNHERSIIEAVFLDGMLQKDVAKTANVTPSRISQIIRQAFSKLRNPAPAKPSIPKRVRITINGNAYYVLKDTPVSAKDIRRRLANKIGFKPLPGHNKARVDYHRFLKTDWQPIGRGLKFESGMAFQVLVKAKRRRGCRIVKGPHGGIAFACTRGDGNA